MQIQTYIMQMQNSIKRISDNAIMNIASEWEGETDAHMPACVVSNA